MIMTCFINKLLNLLNSYLKLLKNILKYIYKYHMINFNSFFNIYKKKLKILFSQIFIFILK